MTEDEYTRCCDNCRFYRGPKPAEYARTRDDFANQPWYCMHPFNDQEGFVCPIEDCAYFRSNTFGCVTDPTVRKHYWLTEGAEGLGLEDDDDRWPF